MRFLFFIVLAQVMMLVSCSQWMVRYQQHDPGSYCLERQTEIRFRPAVICTGMDMKKDCSYAATLELHWKCVHWSSW